MLAQKRKLEAKAKPKSDAKKKAKRTKQEDPAVAPPPVSEEWPADEWLEGEEDEDPDGYPFDSDEEING